MIEIEVEGLQLMTRFDSVFNRSKPLDMKGSDVPDLSEEAEGNAFGLKHALNEIGVIRKRRTRAKADIKRVNVDEVSRPR